MKKKIYYWAPYLNEVGTVKSAINSAISLKKFSNDKFEPIIINACGEWDKYINVFSSYNIQVINLSLLNYFRFLPKNGYINSRFSYIIIFIFSLIPLLKILKKNNESYLIAHLITSLPLFLFYIFNFDLKLILRISGFPKLNFVRKSFWKIVSDKVNLISCPSQELLNKLKKLDIFPSERIEFLPDAIFQIKDFFLKKKTKDNFINKIDKKIILSVGRLTRQKNFKFLIEEFHSFKKFNNNYILIILGEGEEEKNLRKIIHSKGLINSVFLLGRVENVFNIMKKAEIFILSSLWEDPGFVLIEAGLSNLFVISSDCPNGPKEILENGRNGYLFKSNDQNQIVKNLIKYNEINKNDKLKMQVGLKKNIMKYSIYRHYLLMKKIIFKIN